MTKYEELSFYEARKTPDTIVVALWGSSTHYMAFNQSAMYFNRRFGTRLMKNVYSTIGETIHAGFPKGNYVKCLQGLKELQRPSAGIIIYQLPQGMTTPSQSDVEQFLKANGCYVSAKAKHKQLLVERALLLDEAKKNEPKKTHIGDLFSNIEPGAPKRPSKSPEPLNTAPVIQVEVPRKIPQLPQEVHGLPIVQKVCILINYWYTLKKHIKEPYQTQFYNTVLFTAMRIKHIATCIYDNRAYATPEEQHNAFMQLHNQVEILFTIFDLFKQQQVLSPRRIAILAKCYLDIKKHLIMWRSHPRSEEPKTISPTHHDDNAS